MPGALDLSVGATIPPDLARPDSSPHWPPALVSLWAISRYVVSPVQARYHRRWRPDCTFGRCIAGDDVTGVRWGGDERRPLPQSRMGLALLRTADRRSRRRAADARARSGRIEVVYGARRRLPLLSGRCRRRGDHRNSGGQRISPGGCPPDARSLGWRASINA